MMQHKKGIVFLLTLTAILTLSLIGCERTQNDITESSVSETTNLIEEEQTVNNDDVNRVSENETTQTDGEIVAPTKEEVLAEIKKVLIDEFELDEARLVPDAKLFEDLDLDSIDAVDLVVRLQNITGLKVKAEDFKSIRTLGDVADVIVRLISEQQK